MIRLPMAVRPIWRFALHMFSGSFAFLIFFSVAVAIAGYVNIIEAMRWADQDTIQLGRFAQKGIEWADIFTLAFFVLNEVLKTCWDLVYGRV